MNTKFPKWLDSFELTISDEKENGLFNSTDFDINEIRFTEPLGGQIGSKLMIRNKKYKIVNAHFLTDITEKHKGKTEGYRFQLEIIVSEEKS